MLRLIINLLRRKKETAGDINIEVLRRLNDIDGVQVYGLTVSAS